MRKLALPLVFMASVAGADTIIENKPGGTVSGDFTRLVIKDSPGLKLRNVTFESIDIDENSPNITLDGFVAEVSGEEGVLVRSHGFQARNGRMSIKEGTKTQDDFIEFQPVKYPTQYRAAWPDAEEYKYGEPKRNPDWLWWSTKTRGGKELWYGIDDSMMIEGGVVENVVFDGRGAPTRAGIFSDYVKGGWYRNCKFIGFRDQGITIERNIRSVVVDCEFWDGVPETSGGGLGILNFGIGNVVRDCRFYNAPLMIAPLSQPQLDLTAENLLMRGRGVWVKYPGALWLEATFRNIEIKDRWFMVDADQSPVVAKVNIDGLTVVSPGEKTVTLSGVNGVFERLRLTGRSGVFDYNAKVPGSQVTLKDVLLNGDAQESVKRAKALTPPTSSSEPLP